MNWDIAFKILCLFGLVYFSVAIWFLMKSDKDLWKYVCHLLRRISELSLEIHNLKGKGILEPVPGIEEEGRRLKEAFLKEEKEEKL